MAKLTLNTIGSRYGSIDALNDNFNAIEQAIENTFSLNGTSPNALEADLDMNNNAILNASEVDTTTLRINGVLVEPGTSVTSGAAFQTYAYTATAGQTTFSVSPATPYNASIVVIVNGLQLSPSEINVSGTNVITPALTLGDEVVIRRYTAEPVAAPDAEEVNYLPSGTGAVTRTVQNKLREFKSTDDIGGTVADAINQLSYTTPGTITTSDTEFYGSVYSPLPSVGIHAKTYTIGTVTANVEQSAVDYKRIKYTGNRFIDINNSFGENHGSGEVGLFTGTVQGWGTGNIIGFTAEAQAKVATIPYTYAADLRVKNDFAPTIRGSVVNAVTSGAVGVHSVYYSAATGGAPQYHFYSAGLGASVADIYLIGNGVLKSSLGSQTISITELAANKNQWQITDIIKNSGFTGTVNSTVMSVDATSLITIYEVTLLQYGSTYMSTKRYLVNMSYNRDCSVNNGILLQDTVLVGSGDLNRVTLGLTSTASPSAKTITYTVTTGVDFEVFVRKIR